MAANLTLSLVEYNFLVNPGFEEGDTGWTVTDLRKADELYVEEKATDSLSEKKYLHLWSAAPYSVEFTAEQQVMDLPAGQYRYSVSIMGGDCGETNVYAYVKVDGETVVTAPMRITSFGSWDTASVPVFSCEAGQSVAVGIYVQCQGTGSGAWGKIDDAVLRQYRTIRRQHLRRILHDLLPAKISIYRQ